MADRLRVLHLIEGLGSGGAERLLYTNLAHIDNETFQNEVVTVFSHGDHWKQQILDLGISVSSLECVGYRDILAGVKRFKKHIDRTRPQLIHTHLFAANIIGRFAGRRAGIPVISSIHNPEYEPEAVAGASTVVRAKVRVAQMIDKATAGRCSRMIAVSNYVKRSAAARLGYPSSKIDVIYNPAEVDIEQSVNRRSVRDDLGLDPNAFVVLNAGRLSPQKGFIDAVRAWPAISAANSSAVLLSLGSLADLSYLKKVKDEISLLGLNRSIKLLGERRDVHKLMLASDLFLFPSLFEGLGIALVEAMIAGLPCIASDIAPITEFITHGESGLLIKTNDPDAIAAAVISIINSPALRKQMIDNARQTAAEMFDPARAAAQLQSVYLNVLEEKASV